MPPSVCLGCGCACDDIELEVEANRIVAARNACPLGVAWFGDGVVPARVTIRGRDATVDEAVDAASSLLIDARRPMVYLAADISCEAQRESIALADRLGAAVDSLTSSTAMGSLLAAQEQGRASATLGEIRNRADVVAFWGVDPSLRYPRYWTRYAPEPIGVHVAEGRRSRTVVAVDVGDRRGPADADVRVAVAPESEVAVLTWLAASVGVKVSSRRGDAHEEIRSAMVAGRYVAIVADAEPDDGGGDADPGRTSALIALAQALNATTRCALSLLRAGGNRSGAEACITSQTGYPAAVDFARGYPRYRPHDVPFRLKRGAVDTVVVFGSAASIPAPLVDVLKNVPCVVAGPGASSGPLSRGEVIIDTGIAGIHEAGTAIRMDDVPLPLRARLSGPPAAAAIARALYARIDAHRVRFGP